MSDPCVDVTCGCTPGGGPRRPIRHPIGTRSVPLTDPLAALRPARIAGISVRSRPVRPSLLSDRQVPVERSGGTRTWRGMDPGASGREERFRRLYAGSRLLVSLTEDRCPASARERGVERLRQASTEMAGRITLTCTQVRMARAEKASDSPTGARTQYQSGQVPPVRS